MSMKNYKGLVPIVLAVCLVLSFYMLITTRADVANQYNTYLKQAREYGEKGIVVDAVYNYNAAMAIKDSLDLHLEVGNLYVQMEELDMAIAWGQKMVENYPTEAAAYEFLLTRYRANSDFHRCFALYEVIQKRELASEKITEIMKDIQYVFYYGEAFDDVGPYSDGYYSVNREGKWGLATVNGNTAVYARYASVGAFVNGLAPVKTFDGEVYFIDVDGNKKKVVTAAGNLTELQPMVGDLYAGFDGVSWAFYNTNDKKVSEDYSNVSLMANGVAAVQKDGRWQVVDGNFNPISTDTYTDVVQDDRGVACRNGVIFVNKGNGYYMIDTTGKQVCDKVFEDVRLFGDQTYAAVETAQGWTFIDGKGEFVFKDRYFDDARSFVNGFAAVCGDGLWGYIDQEGNEVIAYQFMDAKDFSPKGCAFVKTENAWILLRLYSKNYEK